MAGRHTTIFQQVALTFLLEFHCLPTVQQVVTVVGHLSHTEVTVVRNLHAVILLTLLSGDDDNTIRTLRTVDRGGSGILQDLHRLDIVGVHSVDIHA